MNTRIPFEKHKHGSVLETPDGKVMVVFERVLAHPPEIVWQALTDPDKLHQWFPGIQLVQQQGGVFNIWFGGECEGPAHVSGIVEVYDPPNKLVMGSMCYELEPISQGCLLRFTDILHFDGSRTKIHHALLVLPGWHSYLDNLEAQLDQQPERFGAPEIDYRNIEVPGWSILKTED